MIRVPFATGTIETAIHFVIYEHLKKLFKERRENYQMQPLDCVLAAGLAKMTASSTCYPHGKEWDDLVPILYLGTLIVFMVNVA
jgi:hypothetical protein